MESNKLSQEEIDQLVGRLNLYAKTIDNDDPFVVKVEGKEVKVKMPVEGAMNRVRNLMDAIRYAPEPDNDIDRKKLAKRSRRIHAKAASLILLNRWCIIPFVHAIHWRYLLWRRTAKYLSGVIGCGVTNAEEAFFLRSYLALRNQKESVLTAERIPQK